MQRFLPICEKTPTNPPIYLRPPATIHKQSNHEQQNSTLLPPAISSQSQIWQLSSLPDKITTEIVLHHPHHHHMGRRITLFK